MLDVVGSVTVVKAVACGSIADPAVEGGFCLAARLFASVIVANFLPFGPLPTSDSDAGGPFAVCVDPGNGFAGSLASLVACFLGVDFLGFGLDDSSTTMISSSKLTAFLGLPRFLTASLDMMAETGCSRLCRKAGVEFWIPRRVP